MAKMSELDIAVKNLEDGGYAVTVKEDGDVTIETPLLTGVLQNDVLTVLRGPKVIGQELSVIGDDVISYMLAYHLQQFALDVRPLDSGRAVVVLYQRIDRREMSDYAFFHTEDRGSEITLWGGLGNNRCPSTMGAHEWRDSMQSWTLTALKYLVPELSNAYMTFTAGQWIVNDLSGNLAYLTKSKYRRW